MTRRSLFSTLLGAAIAPYAARVAGKVKAPIAKIRRSRNVGLNPELFQRECMLALKNNLAFARAVNESYAADFEGVHKIGKTIQVRKPMRFHAS